MTSSCMPRGWLSRFRRPSYHPWIWMRLRVAMDGGLLGADQCYQAFRTMGLDYGPGFQGIEAIYLGGDRVLAKLCLPASVAGSCDPYVLHPSLMDAALQASIGPDPAAGH